MCALGHNSSHMLCCIVLDVFVGCCMFFFKNWNVFFIVFVMFVSEVLCMCFGGWCLFTEIPTYKHVSRIAPFLISLFKC